VLRVLRVFLEDAMDRVGRDPVGHDLGEVWLTESFTHTNSVCPAERNLTPSKERERNLSAPCVQAGKISVMASWAELEGAAPEFATRVRALMSSRRHLTMATLRRDGSPRISGTEVQFVDGQLEIGSMPGAVKALDLRRDPRVAIHGPTEDPPSGRPAGWKGESKVAGIAREVESGSDAHRFQIDIHEAVITHLNEAGDRLVIESWNEASGYRTKDRE
jgi:hypothetical protein